MSFDEITRKHEKDWKDYLDTGDISDNLYNDFYEHYVNNGEMPYGIAKARTGDPHQWIYDTVYEQVYPRRNYYRV